MLVLDGALTETVYASNAIIGPDSVAMDGGMATVHHAGAYTYIDDDIGLHKVGNATRERAMTLHIYAPGWETVQLYDETMPPEVTDAGGVAIDVDAWGD